MSYWNRQQNLPEVVLGGIPLLRSSHFRDLGQEYWNSTGEFSFYRAPQDLERLQRLIHQKGQENDETEEGKENSIVLISKHTLYGRTNHNKIPYHEDILPRWEAFADSAQKREGLTRIVINNIVLPPTSYFVQKFLPILNNNDDTLMALELSGCDLGSDQINLLAKYIKKNKSISTLDLSGNKMDDIDAAKLLAQAIKKHPELCFLSLSDCALGASTTRNSYGSIVVSKHGGNDEVLSTLLGACKKLKTLLLEDNYIKTEGTVALVAKFLKNNKSLTVFSMQGNELGDANVNVLCDTLAKCTNVSELCLGKARITLPTFINIKQMMNLTCLDMGGDWYWGSNNNEPTTIGAPGAKLIAKYLASNPALIELNLNGNDVNSQGAKKIALALKKNTNLQHLSLAYNRLTKACVPAFTDALRNNDTLLSLNLGGNEIRVETGRAVLNRNALCDTSSLEAIVESNHTCVLTTSEGKKYRNDLTHEYEMKKINSLDSEGMKIRYKVVLALFSYNKDLFHPRSFDDVPLELMPRLLELVQLEVGYGEFGNGITERSTKKKKSPHTLRRLYQVVTEWNTPELVFRGPGKGSLTSTGRLKTKRDKTKRVLKIADEDEDWTPNGAPKKKKRRNRWRAPSQQSSSGGAGSTTESSNSRSKRSTRNTVSYADVENSEDES